MLPPVDVAALESGLAEHLHHSMVGGLAPGVDGWVDDDLAFVTSWELDLQTLRLMVPFAHGHWLAAHVPGAEAWLKDDEVHLTLLQGIGQVHAWLREKWAA